MNSIRSQIPKFGTHLILIFFAFTALAPLSLVVVNSFKTHPEVVRNPVALPEVFDFENYSEAWKFGKFARGFINSAILSGTAIITTVASSSLAGYVLARKKVKVWPIVMIYFMVAMTVPIQLFLFPLYFIFVRLNLLGNLVAVGVVLAALNMPLSVFLMRSFFLGVPVELEEAASIDGAGIVQILWYVMLPAVSPGMITVAVIVGLLSWNEFLITSTFLQGEQNFTATLGFLSMNGTYTVDQGLMMAAAVIMIAPVIIFFISIQRYFIDGLVSGALKG